MSYPLGAECRSLRTSPRHQAEAQTAYVYMGLRFHQGLGQQGAWTTDGIMGLWRGPMQTVNLPWSLAFVFAQSQGAPVARFWGWICICLSSRLLYTIHWPCWATTASRAQACLSLSLSSHLQFYLLLSKALSPLRITQLITNRVRILDFTQNLDL